MTERGQRAICIAVFVVIVGAVGPLGVAIGPAVSGLPLFLTLLLSEALGALLAFIASSTWRMKP